ncbi:unnamed protein product [Urochloa humidicola]
METEELLAPSADGSHLHPLLFLQRRLSSNYGSSTVRHQNIWKKIHLFAANFCQVEAQEQPEISEAYGVTAVPYFVFYKVQCPTSIWHCCQIQLAGLLTDLPNPSVDASEAVIGEDLSLAGALESVQADFKIIITTYGELDKNNYLDPRTAQVATVDHIKQDHYIASAFLLYKWW